MRRSLFVVFALSITVPVIADAPSKAPVEESINQLVAQFGDGIAVSYDKYRRIEFGKIFGSDRDDAIALFSIEGFGGGNGHAEYLAFFESVEKNEMAKAKSRPFRLVGVTQTEAVGGVVSTEKRSQSAGVL